MNRWVGLASVLLLHCTGCLYYAYPTFSYVPELTVPNPDLSVHAFRVDIDTTERKPDPPLSQYTLARLFMDEHGSIASQLEVAPATGIYNPLGLVDGIPHEHSQYTMTVRLYRPRYCTQEVKAGQKAHEVHWTEAPNLLAQEKAVDDLLGPPTLPGPNAGKTWWELKDQKSPGLQPGLTSRMHREALDFASKEYQRLVDSREASSPGMQEVSGRLRSKAQWLRTYADKPPAPEVR